MAERLLYFMLGARALVTEAAGSEGPQYDTTQRAVCSRRLRGGQRHRRRAECLEVAIGRRHSRIGSAPPTARPPGPAVVVVFGKVGVTGLSMLISVWVYAAVWGLGWAAAVGFVALLFVHEMGHWLMMRYKGVPATAPLFIPFLGAVIGMRGMPNSVQDEAAIGIAGPLAGTAGALLCLGLARLYGGHLWPLLAMMGLFLNLFNLLPVSPLDGGRIAGAISRWLWPVGLAGLVGVFLLHPNPFLLLIVLVGGVQTIARFRGRYAPTARPGYADLRVRERVTMGLLYFGLIALIAAAMLGTPLV